MPKISKITGAKFREASVTARLDALTQMVVDLAAQRLADVPGLHRTAEEIQAKVELQLLALTGSGTV